MAKKPRLPQLTDLFILDEDYLVTPDRARLRPALVWARRQDERVLVKYWDKIGSYVDKDLSDIWRREMRMAERIRVRPRADELLVPVIETGEAYDAFYLVMPGEWTPLAAKRRNL